MIYQSNTTEMDVRESTLEKCSNVLYEDARFFVGQSKQGRDSHYLLINDTQTYLGPGVLRELALRDGRYLEKELEQIAPDMMEELFRNRINTSDLGWVLLKAVTSQNY